MAAYTFVGTSEMKNIEAYSTYEVDLKHTFSSSSFVKMNLIEANSTYEFQSAELPPVTATMIDNFTINLLFNPTMHYAKFELNNHVISEMSIIDDEHIFNLNPAMLFEGENILRIYIYDNDEMEHLKVFKVNKELTPSGLAIGDVLHVKGKRYNVSNVDDETVTLNQTLATDINANTFAELPSFITVPYANLGFYNDNVVPFPMNFAKAIFKDGMIEEMHELENVLGDVLHTKIEIVRDDVSKVINISNVEFITIPNEV